ncbi:magnesium/cobalt transporter CorA [Candidatus Ornithobacterium hominis]|uniref:magnesium/cobalt transporter CorA n=1 Tax=Candidatus Ornithobacterium hominis TaxID=2497989 RepID=UPI000E5A57D4|nr:magnesium/cobalt transporter CorA [Candidatus Ornithobacterium hominis]CAI9430427.1 magnesium/cobalt transporter CorA [Candidatus Ornithobacterium hominis]SZD71969.1 Magnesium transport protein CorA [Candidatus Ornithobacterium hominis]
MITYFLVENDKLVQKKEANPKDHNLIWVDLIDPTEQEKAFVEKAFKIELFTDQESEEIEISSRYIEEENEIGINMNFTYRKDDDEYLEAVSFILKNGILFTERDNEYLTFRATYRRMRINRPFSGEHAFLMILDTRIDALADNIERVTDKISKLTRSLVKDEILDSETLKELTSMQDKSMIIRESSMELQRVLSSISKSRIFPNEHQDTIRIMMKDLSSLLEHTAFNFHRLEFLQDSFQSLVDMEQNKIMKVFTIMTVIFAPPTLIAGIYGMNFQDMPELNYEFGYPLALLSIVLIMIAPLFYFKMKKWL